MKRMLTLATLLLMAVILTGINPASAADPASTAAGSTFEQRLAQRKAERGVALSPQDSQRIVSVCVNAQSTVRSLQIEDVKALDKRATVYNTIDAKLLIAAGEIRLAGQDTFHLEEQRQAYATKINNFKNLSGNYKQVIDDLLLVNCKADPAGFKALLETARIYNDQMRAQATEIRGYVVDTIKTTLRTHADDLQTNAGSGDESR